MQSWAAAIADGDRCVDGLLARATAWQRAELDRLLQDVVAESSAPAPTSRELSLPELRSLLADRLRGRPSRANFRTGHLTVCTLVPMRSVPHRVVCLLGLDDGAFPRHGAPDGDDIIERAPMVGDHDVRSEDRQLLLDALLAAGDHLVVTYSGRDERTNARRPPCVPIGELLDVIDATARTADGPARRPRPRPSTRCRRSTPATSSPAGSWPTRRGASTLTARDGARGPRRRREPTRPSFLDARSCRRSTRRWSSSTTSCSSCSTRPRRSSASASASASARWTTSSTTPSRSSSTASAAGASAIVCSPPARPAPTGRRRSMPSGRVACSRRASSASGSSTRSARPSTPSTPRRCAEIGGAGDVRSMDVAVDLGDAGVLVGTVAGVHGDDRW